MSLIKNLGIVGFAFGVFAILFYTPHELFCGVWTLEFGSISKRDKAKSWIPVWNVAQAETLYTGKTSSVLVTTIIAIVCLALRVLCSVCFGGSVVGNVLTICLLQLSVIAIIVANIVFVFRIMRSVKCCSLLKCILMSIAYPLGQDYIGKFLPTLVKNYAKGDVTFDEDSDFT